MRVPAAEAEPGGGRGGGEGRQLQTPPGATAPAGSRTPPTAPAPPPPRGSLRSAELADAAVLGGVTLVLCLVGWFVPHASAATALAAVPMAVLAHRRRPRAVVAATVAGGAVGFLVAGSGPVASVAGCALVGGLAGHARRRGWGLGLTVAAACALGPPLGAAADGLLAVFPQSRRLTLAQVRNTWNGVGTLLRHTVGSGPVVGALTTAVDDAVRWWWISVPAGVLLSAVGAVIVAWVVAGAVLERLAWVPAADVLPPDAAGAPEPLPVRLVGVTFRYPGAEGDALGGVDVAVQAGTFTVVVGPNGSGKSTLARILLGAEPGGGAVLRPGPPGLGRRGGSALVQQRPETQVLGVRVIDDLLWGIAPGEQVDVAGLLDLVGLAGAEHRDTSTLSGGELQRLAVASALVRRPRLLVSDESTAMVDADGRRALIALMRRLAHEQGTAVVHVTHRQEEAAGADQVVALRSGLRIPAGQSEPGPPAGWDGGPAAGWDGGPAAGWDGGPPPRWDGGPAALGDGGSAALGLARQGRAGPDRWAAAADLYLVGVGHTWAAGTPWRRRALEGIDLRIGAGEGVLVLGANGSGKSTLAWVLAGLLRPTEGECLLGGIPVHTRVGAVGLAFQHARLQLQKPTVMGDVCHAGGVGGAAASEALEMVGLDPDRLGRRHIDELSGGQMRRVALAGILARRPQILVLDEPLAGLDERGRNALLYALGRLQSEKGVTIVLVSHDVGGTERCCQRLVRLEAGRITADQPLLAVRP